MENSVHNPRSNSQVLFTSEVVNESSAAWSRIRAGSYLLEIRIVHDYIRVINTPQGEELYESQRDDTRTVPVSITEAQTSSSKALAAFVAENVRGMEQYIGETRISQICTFLTRFMRINPPGTQRMAVVEVLVSTFRDDNEQEFADVEGRLLEFRARLVDTAESHDMELVKYQTGVGEVTCSICFDEFEKETEVVQTGCSHYFHEKCIGVWMISKTTCPLCRSKIR